MQSLFLLVETMMFQFKFEQCVFCGEKDTFYFMYRVDIYSCGKYKYWKKIVCIQGWNSKMHKIALPPCFLYLLQIIKIEQKSEFKIIYTNFNGISSKY